MDIIIASPIIIIIGIGIIYILLLGIYTDKNILKIAKIILGIALILEIINPYKEKIIFEGFMKSTIYITYFSIIIIIGTIIVIKLTEEKIKEIGSPLELALLYLINTLGVLITISGAELIIIYLGIEIQTLSLFILVSYIKKSEIGLEAGIKYFILSAISSAILLLGIVLIYLITGTTEIIVIETIGIYKPNNIIIGIILIIIGLLFKLALAPFHIWLPDIYQGAPDIITAYLAIVPKLAIIGIIGYLYMNIFIYYEIEELIKISIIISIIIGAIMGIGQKDMKRLFAYSTIGHLGNILIGLTGTIIGIQGILIYSTIYCITNIALFTIIIGKRKERNITIEDLIGYGKTNKMIGVIIGIILFSLAGIPPLAGFFSKYFIYLSSIEAGNIILPIVGVFGSVVSAYYYIRIINYMFFVDTIQNPIEIQLNNVASKILYIAMIIITGIIINPTGLLICTESVSISMLI